MHKFWKIQKSKSNKLILIKDKCIYRGNPKESDFNRMNLETSNLSFLNELFSIPYSYIHKIENQKAKKYIKVFYGKDSEDELIFEKEEMKNEVFKFIKSDVSGFSYSSKVPSILKYAKAHFFALFIVTGIFVWSLYIAVQIENGIEYELVGGRPGLAGIVLVIANLGVLKVIIGYVLLLLIIVFTLIKKLKSRTNIETLKRN